MSKSIEVSLFIVLCLLFVVCIVFLQKHKNSHSSIFHRQTSEICLLFQTLDSSGMSGMSDMSGMSEMSGVSDMSDNTLRRDSRAERREKSTYCLVR